MSLNPKNWPAVVADFLVNLFQDVSIEVDGSAAGSSSYALILKCIDNTGNPLWWRVLANPVSTDEYLSFEVSADEGMSWAYQARINEAGISNFKNRMRVFGGTESLPGYSDTTNDNTGLHLPRDNTVCIVGGGNTEGCFSSGRLTLGASVNNGVSITRITQKTTDATQTALSPAIEINEDETVFIKIDLFTMSENGESETTHSLQSTRTYVFTRDAGGDALLMNSGPVTNDIPAGTDISYTVDVGATPSPITDPQDLVIKVTGYAATDINWDMMVTVMSTPKPV